MDYCSFIIKKNGEPRGGHGPYWPYLSSALDYNVLTFSRFSGLSSAKSIFMLLDIFSLVIIFIRDARDQIYRISDFSLGFLEA
jgi:hypothetical protein